MGDGAVWYVAYGSNLSSARFQRYLDACTDPTPPRERVVCELPYRLFFAHESTLWSGGTAFIEPVDTAARTLAVAWSITTQQFLHVLARENGGSSARIAAHDLPAPGVAARLVDGRYGLVLGVDSPDDRPAYTFTTGDDPLPAPTQPAVGYADTIVAGLAECHGLAEAEARGYLGACGVSVEVGPVADPGEQVTERLERGPVGEEGADVAAESQVAGDERIERRPGP